MIDRFNIRVYMLILDEDKILVSDEVIRVGHYTKFPGGGLEYGEGLLDCLHREALEELGQAIVEPIHLYTTDFFQQSAFRAEDQIVSVYYRCQLEGQPEFRISNIMHDFLPGKRQSFRWVKLNELKEEDLSYFNRQEGSRHSSNLKDLSKPLLNHAGNNLVKVSWVQSSPRNSIEFSA